MVHRLRSTRRSSSLGPSRCAGLHFRGLHLPSCIPNCPHSYQHPNKISMGHCFKKVRQPTSPVLLYVQSFVVTATKPLVGLSRTHARALLERQPLYGLKLVMGRTRARPTCLLAPRASNSYNQMARDSKLEKKKRLELRRKFFFTKKIVSFTYAKRAVGVGGQDAHAYDRHRQSVN